MSSWRCFPFVDSAPRAYRLKASNAAPSSSTSTGTFPCLVESPEVRKYSVSDGESLVMRLIALVVAVLTGLIAPAFAQRAEIEAVNAKWVDFFNKGDLAGVASLYTEDATAFPPGAGMMKGRAAIAAMWKGAAEQVGDPKFITLEVKPLGPSAAQEIGTFSLKMKGQTPQEVTGKYLVVWEKVGTDWKLSAAVWDEGKEARPFQTARFSVLLVRGPSAPVRLAGCRRNEGHRKIRTDTVHL